MSVGQSGIVKSLVNSGEIWCFCNVPNVYIRFRDVVLGSG